MATIQPAWLPARRCSESCGPQNWPHKSLGKANPSIPFRLSWHVPKLPVAQPDYTFSEMCGGHIAYAVDALPWWPRTKSTRCRPNRGQPPTGSLAHPDRTQGRGYERPSLRRVVINRRRQRVKLSHTWWHHRTLWSTAIMSPSPAMNPSP